MRQAVILILSGLALNGCVPVPVPRELVPPINGVLEKDGKPVAGAEVRSIAGPQSSLTVVTDGEGRFRTGALWDAVFGIYMVPVNFASPDDALEVHFAGERYAKRYVGYLSQETGGVVCEITDTAEKETIDDVDNMLNPKVEVRRLSCRKR